MKLIRTQHWTPVMVLLVSALTVRASTTNFFTGFETNQGYSVGSPLVGSQGWVGVLAKAGQVTNATAAGNGITNSPLPTQQAYIGWTPIPGTYTNLSVWQPLTPIAANATNVTFTIQMETLDGTGGVSGNNYDRFLWQVCNAQSNLLLAIRFDEYSDQISYWLSASNAWFTNNSYSPEQVYTLAIMMNPASNVWSAVLTNNSANTFATLATAQLMAPAGTNLSIAYIAASWNIATPGSPGDNLMAFDNYLITSDVPATQPPSRPQLTLRSASAGGPATIRLTGQNGYRFALDAGTNLTATTNWTALVTNTVTTNSFNYTDAGAAGLGRRYYRGRWVP